jgi:hypothetical protein
MAGRNDGSVLALGSLLASPSSLLAVAVEGRSPMTVAGPRRICTGFLHRHHLTADIVAPVLSERRLITRILSAKTRLAPLQNPEPQRKQQSHFGVGKRGHPPDRNRLSLSNIEYPIDLAARRGNLSGTPKSAGAQWPTNGVCLAELCGSGLRCRSPPGRDIEQHRDHQSHQYPQHDREIDPASKRRRARKCVSQRYHRK